MSSPRFSKYRQALEALSARTRTPLPSLIFSFGILHELTAILPLVGVFYGARELGVGERVVAAIRGNAEFPETSDGTREAKDDLWWKEKMRDWMQEGEGWAERMGKRYGFFGYEKGQEPSRTAVRAVAGDVANAVVAYSATKALLPLRIGASLYLSPAFSRTVVEPIRRGFVGLFRR